MIAERRGPETGEVKALPPSPEKRLWFGLLAGPAAWTLHEVGGYAVAANGCALGADALPAWSWIGLAALTVVSLGTTAAAGWVALREFRRATGPVPVYRTEGWGRVEFMAAGGVFVSAALLLNMLMFGVMPLIVDPCVMVS